VKRKSSIAAATGQPEKRQQLKSGDAGMAADDGGGMDGSATRAASRGQYQRQRMASEMAGNSVIKCRWISAGEENENGLCGSATYEKSGRNRERKLSGGRISRIISIF